MLKKFDGVIFDLDGTLLDSLGMWANIDRSFLRNRNIPLPPDYAQAVRHMTFSEAAIYTVKRFSLPESPKTLEAEWYAMAVHAYHHEIELKEGALETLCFIKSRSLKMGIATSGKKELFLPTLTRCGISDFFDTIMTTDEVGIGKESPDVFFSVAQRLGTSSERCLVVEDSAAALRSARQGGFYAVGVYDPLTENEAEVRREAHCYLTSLKEFVPRFEKVI